MLASLSGCKKPVIGIVNAGGNIEMQKWEPSLKGLSWGFYGGQEAEQLSAKLYSVKLTHQENYL